ncbi:beta and beta-prime subunits of DNA dependent RNA-polymerase, partial [Lichtheimia hyalospora FSU 10163]
MNPSLCTAYNADFDGDEMNIFYFKDYKSISEAKYINSSINCIISPQNYNPIIYLSQDYIFGMYMLSKNNT